MDYSVLKTHLDNEDYQSFFDYLREHQKKLNIHLQVDALNLSLAYLGGKLKGKLLANYCKEFVDKCEAPPKFTVTFDLQNQVDELLEMYNKIK